MKICPKCQTPFPIWNNINGKLHCLNSRKFCLKCSPFKQHNTKDLTTTDYKPVFIERNGKKYKLCPECEEYKELNCDNYYITKSGRFHHYCKPCGKEQTIKRQREIKLKAIAYKGNKCCICGYDKYFGSLTFHHSDPSKKEYGIAEGRCYNFEKLKQELDKCILVCRNCHGEIEGGINTNPHPL